MKFIRPPLFLPWIHGDILRTRVCLAEKPPFLGCRASTLSSLPPPLFFFLFSAAPSVVFESQQRRNSLLSVCSLGGRAVRCFVSGRCSAMRALLFAREALFRGIISRAQARALPAHEKYTFAAEPRDRLAGLCGLCIFRFYRVENFAGRPS